MNRTTVELIKERVPIEELLSSYLKLEKAGKSFKARCPFHNEKTASFFVSPERGGYYCFGCGAKGDIFSFVEQFEGLDFRGGLKVLAEKAGIPLVIDQKADGERDRIFQITEEAAKYFEDQYERSSAAKDYLKSRGISPETRKDFRIGWAPEDWQGLFNQLKSRGWKEDFIEKAGLAKKRESGPGYYDRFRGRIIFPITDSSGRVIAFTGRILKDDGKSAKYLNSPDTPLFNKSRILFGLDKAKSEIRRVGYSILVEGQMDLVLSHQVGVKNTVAASGTALTDQQNDKDGVASNLELVHRLSPNMIIAMDSDKAGRAAAMRAVAATALSLGMAVKIAEIEGGKDPADLILSNPENWRNVLKNAKHVVDFELNNILKEVTDPHKVSRAVKERIFPFLARIESEMDKAYYVKVIAERTNISERAVWDDFRKTNQGTVAEESFSNKSSLPLSAGSPTSVSSLNSTSRFDLVERRMFGLLALLENAGLPSAADYREQIKKIASESYESRLAKIKPLLPELSFEAESLFGTDPNRLNIHMKEVISNFEEDLINLDLIKTMGELKIAEKAADQAKVTELAKKCQVLSIRKAEVARRKI